MANPKKRTLTSAGVALETLEETTRSALHMLVALAPASGSYAPIYNGGYAHARGWHLRRRLVGPPGPATQPDDINGGLIRTALTRHPDACHRILAGLPPADAIASPALIRLGLATRRPKTTSTSSTRPHSTVRPRSRTWSSRSTAPAPN